MFEGEEKIILNDNCSFLFVKVKTIIDYIAEATKDDNAYIDVFSVVKGKEGEILKKLLN